MTAQSKIKAASPESRPSTFGAVPRSGYAWPLAGILIVLALQFSMIFTRAINWDEFFHYSLVVDFTRGTVSQPLQTIFVRFFQWLVLLPGTGVDRIIAARIVMFACEMVTVTAIAKLAARFAGRTTGLLCALAYLSAGFVLQHGFSFRFDPVDAALLMSALGVLGCTRFSGRWVLLFAALGGLAAAYTIKCVLYAPAFAGLAWLRWSEAEDKRRFAMNLAAASAGSVMLCAALLLFHSRAFPHLGGSVGSQLHESSSQMFALGPSALYGRYVVKAILTAPVLAGLIVWTPFALRSASRPSPQTVALAGLWLPITTLAFYQNTAPYFYVFILAPVAVACSVALSRLVEAIGSKVAATLFVAMAAMLWAGEDRVVIDRQRALVSAADAIFPTRVAYFASGAMLAQEDKANPFMTPWGTKMYLRGDLPSMRDTMRQKPVPLLFAGDPIFVDAIQRGRDNPNFRPEDITAMRETYLPFWGPYWVAGKVVAATEKDFPKNILVPGPYSLTGAAIEVDGHLVRPGEIVNLDRGVHRFTAVDKEPARLWWGEHLSAPDQPPPTRPYKVAF